MRILFAVLCLVTLSPAVEETTSVASSPSAESSETEKDSIDVSPSLAESTGTSSAEDEDSLIGYTQVTPGRKEVQGDPKRDSKYSPITGKRTLTTAGIGPGRKLPPVVTENPSNCIQPTKKEDVQELADLLDEIFDNITHDPNTAAKFEKLLVERSPRKLKENTPKAIYTLYKEYRAQANNRTSRLPHWYKEAFKSALNSYEEFKFKFWLSEQWKNVTSAEERDQLRVQTDRIQAKFPHIFSYFYQKDPGNWTYVDFLYWELYCIQLVGQTTLSPQPTTVTTNGTTANSIGEATGGPTTAGTGDTATSSSAPEDPTIPGEPTPRPTGGSTGSTGPITATVAPSAPTGATVTTNTGTAITSQGTTTTPATVTETIVIRSTTTRPPENGTVQDPCKVPESIISNIHEWLGRPYANSTRFEEIIDTLPKKVLPIHGKFIMALSRELHKHAASGFHNGSVLLFQELVKSAVLYKSAFELRDRAGQFWCKSSAPDCTGEITEEWAEFETDIFPKIYPNFFGMEKPNPGIYQYLEETFGLEKCIYTCPPLSEEFTDLMQKILARPKDNDTRIRQLLKERNTPQFGKNFPVLVEMARRLLPDTSGHRAEVSLFQTLVYVASDQEPDVDFELFVSNNYQQRVPFAWRYVQQTLYGNVYKDLNKKEPEKGFYDFLKETFSNPEKCRPNQASEPRPTTTTTVITTTPAPTTTLERTTTISGTAGPSSMTVGPFPTEPFTTGTTTGIATKATARPATTWSTVTQPTPIGTTTQPVDFNLDSFGSMVAMAWKCPDPSDAQILQFYLIRDQKRQCVPTMEELQVLLCLIVFYKENSHDDFLPKRHAKAAEMALQGFKLEQIEIYVEDQLMQFPENEQAGYREVVQEAYEEFNKLTTKYLGPNFPQGQRIYEFIITYIACSVRTTLCRENGDQPLAGVKDKIKKILTERKCQLKEDDVATWINMYDYLAESVVYFCDHFLTHYYSNIIELAISNVSSYEIQSFYTPRIWNNLPAGERVILELFYARVLAKFNSASHENKTLIEFITGSMQCPNIPPFIVTTVPTLPGDGGDLATTAAPPSRPEIEGFCSTIATWPGQEAQALLNLICYHHSNVCQQDQNPEILHCVYEHVLSGCKSPCIYQVIAKLTFVEDQQHSPIQIPLILLHHLMKQFVETYYEMYKAATVSSRFVAVYIVEYLRVFYTNIAATGIASADSNLLTISLLDKSFFRRLKKELDRQFYKNLAEWKHNHNQDVVLIARKIHQRTMDLLGTRVGPSEEEKYREIELVLG